MENTGFIARRYLFSKKHISLITTLTVISITGVTIGTALLIVVLSVFNGFFEVIQGFLLSNDPDIRIESVEGSKFLYQPEMISELEGIPELTLAAPYVSGKAMLAFSQRRDRVVTVKGIEPDKFSRLYNFPDKMTEGSYDLGVRQRIPGLIMSRQLMTDLNVHVGDVVVLLSAGGMRKALTQFALPRIYRFEVRGAYSMVQITDNSPVYIDMQAAQRLFDYRNSISGIDVRLDNSDNAEKAKAMLGGMLGGDYKISSWYDLQKPLYDVMYLEKWGSYLILMIIVLVAVLNIVGSLTMIVIQKTRDIGVLLTMGYTPARIRKIFVKQGLYIGLIGCGIGGSLGLLLSWLQKEYGLIKLSSAFIIEAYPASIHLTDVSIILLGSLFLCLAASWYPAKRASSVDPADAVRNE